MNTVTKCTIALLSVLMCVAAVAFGNLVLTNQDVVSVGKKPVLAVSDIAYVPTAKKIDSVAKSSIGWTEKVVARFGSASDENEDADANTEVIWQADQSVYDYYDDVANYEYYDGGNDAELIPYDGSGRYNANLNGAWHSSGDFQFSGGDCYDDGSGYSFTWYSENVLPGGGLDIPGRHVGDEGYVCDGDGNIVIASDNLPYGTVVDVPFGNGTGVVYDSGSGYGNLDVYVSW